MEGIDIVWVEEAEKVSSDSWDTLIPTVRKDGSEIWISFNPETKSATYKRFIENPPPDTRRAHVTFRDNKYFPQVLQRELEYDKRVDYEKYLHIWEGQIKKYAEDLIFRGKLETDVEFDTPDGAQFYFGSDYGYSNDPTVLVRCFIADECLFIDYEAYGYQVEITQLHQFYDTVPCARKWQITGDSQRPDTINFLTQMFLAPNGTVYDGFDVVGAEKGKGSVEDGLEFLRSFRKIIVHKRCPGTKKDFENYRWKRDRITDEIMPIPIDKSNHSPDAIRYALEKYIKSKVSIFEIDYSKVNVIPEN
jgi:phage terminase large subunit